MIDGRRLGCQATIQGDVVIDVPPESQVHKQVVRKAADARAIVMDPATRLYYVEVAEPDMHEPSGDFERLARALRGAVGHRPTSTAPLRVLQSLQPALRKGDWTVTVRSTSDGTATARHRSARLAGLLRGRASTGLAIDVGSTTIAAHLCDLATGDGPRLLRRDEPADPLRRGPDEPRLLRHDEPRRRRRDDRRPCARR